MNRRAFTSLGRGAAVAASVSDLAGAQSTEPQAGTSRGPNPYPRNLAQDDPAHPGYVLSGVDDTTGRKAYYIHLEAKPGKGDEVQRFMRDINTGVNQEPLITKKRCGTDPAMNCFWK